MDFLRGLPQELLFVIVAGVVLLIQFVLKQLRRRAGSRQDIGVPELVIEELPAALALTPTTPSEPQMDSPRWSVAASPPAAIRAARGSHRFSRSALFRDRHDVRKAIVVSAILQPCHAVRPHTID